MVHKPHKPFKCNYCGQCCKQEGTLKAHKRTVHGVVITPEGTEIIVKKQESHPDVIYITEGGKPHLTGDMDDDDDDEDDDE